MFGRYRSQDRVKATPRGLMIDEETERERGGRDEPGEGKHLKCRHTKASRREPIHERRHELDCLKQSSSQQVQSRKQNTQWLLKS